MTCMASSGCTIPKPKGPSTMPADTSSATDGIDTRGTRPARSGAKNATTPTINRPAKEISVMR